MNRWEERKRAVKEMRKERKAWRTRRELKSKGVVDLDGKRNNV